MSNLACLTLLRVSKYTLSLEPNKSYFCVLQTELKGYRKATPGEWFLQNLRDKEVGC